MKIKNIFALLVLVAFVISCTQSQTVQPSPQPAPVSNPPAPTPAPVQTPAPAPQPVVQPTPPVPQKAAPKTVAVSIKGFKFVPADVTVNVGDTVVWTNEDSAPHTVESSDNTITSDELSKGDKFSHTFTKAGTVIYKCGIHASMKGTVTVQ